MSEQHIPQWNVADRLTKARTDAGASRDDMAEILDVHRNTVSNYENGHTNPNRATLRVWALRCGVPYQWLLTGESDPSDGEMSSSKCDSAPLVGQLALAV